MLQPIQSLYNSQPKKMSGFQSLFMLSDKKTKSQPPNQYQYQNQPPPPSQNMNNYQQPPFNQPYSQPQQFGQFGVEGGNNSNGWGTGDGWGNQLGWGTGMGGQGSQGGQMRMQQGYEGGHMKMQQGYEGGQMRMQQGYQQRPEQQPFSQPPPQPRYNQPQPQFKTQSPPQPSQSQYNPPQQIQYIVKNTNISDKNLQKDKYPQLDDYKPPSKQSDTDFIGWAQEKTPEDQAKQKLGETKFVIQIGETILKGNQDKGKTGSVGEPMAFGLGEKFGNVLAEGFFGNTGMNSNTNSNISNPYSEWDQRGQQNSGMRGFGSQRGGKNPSIWQQLDFRMISYSIPSIFEPKKKVIQFPSPFIRYKIIPYLQQKKSLDVTSKSSRLKGLTKNNMIIWQYHGGPNQLFYFRESSPGSKQYFIINLAKGYAVRCPRPDRQQGKDAACFAAPPQNNAANLQYLWRLVERVDSYIIESVMYPNCVFDLYNERTSDGTNVILWELKNAKEQKNQRWRIVPA